MKPRVLLAVMLLVGCGKVAAPADAGPDADLFDGAAQECSVPCGPTQTCCSGSCIDLNLNPASCGKCGNVCAERRCQDGQCLVGGDGGCPAGTKLVWIGGPGATCCPLTERCVSCEPMCPP